MRILAVESPRSLRYLRAVRTTTIQTWLLVGLTLTACSEENAPISPGADTVQDIADSSASDVADSSDTQGPISCSSDLDCEGLSGCCHTTRCLNNTCMPVLKSDCCEVAGPCSVQPMALHRGECVQTCEAYGCAHYLKLGEQSCGAVLWAWDLEKEGLGDLFAHSYSLPYVSWHRSPLRLFEGKPTLRFGHQLCANFQEAAVFPNCESAAEGATVRGYLETPPISLPSELSSLVELWLRPDLGEGAAQLELSVLPEGSSQILLWQGNRLNLTFAQWQPVLVDLSYLAGRTVRLRLAFDGKDGRNTGGEGASLARFAVRTACAEDRTPVEGDACHRSILTPVHGTADALYVSTPFWLTSSGEPGDYSRPCETCASALACHSALSCEQAQCESGLCSYVRASTCCEDITRLASFSDEGWLYEEGWKPSAENSGGAASETLHFGFGEALAPLGESAKGSAWSPPILLETASRWRFDLRLETEWDFGPSSFLGEIDLLEAVVRFEEAEQNVLPEIVVWSSAELGGSTFGEWAKIEVDLGMLKGRKVSLGWRFQTGDAESNSPGGVWIGSPQLAPKCHED